MITRSQTQKQHINYSQHKETQALRFLQQLQQCSNNKERKPFIKSHCHGYSFTVVDPLINELKNYNIYDLSKFKRLFCTIYNDEIYPAITYERNWRPQTSGSKLICFFNYETNVNKIIGQTQFYKLLVELNNIRSNKGLDSFYNKLKNTYPKITKIIDNIHMKDYKLLKQFYKLKTIKAVDEFYLKCGFRDFIK